MSDYRVTAYRGRTGDVWEPGANGRWRVYGHLPAGDVYDTVEALEVGEGPLTAVDVDDVAALLAERDLLDGAIHSFWLHSRWRWITSQMTTSEREAAADAVERYWLVLRDGPEDDVHPDTRADLRWWRS